MATKIELKWQQIYKERLTNRKTGETFYERVDKADDADLATLYAELPTDYSTSTDETKAVVKAKCLELAKTHLDKCGDWKYIDEMSAFISKRGIGFALLKTPKVIVATDTLELP